MTGLISPDSSSNRTLKTRYGDVRSVVQEAQRSALDSGTPKKRVREIRKGAFLAAEAMQERLAIDDLTKLKRRNFFKEQVEKVSAITERDSGMVVDFALMDLDDFGQFNKRYGDLAGDSVLRMTGTTILDAIRDTDIAGRWGGEELAIAFIRNKDQSEENQGTGPERIRQAIHAMEIPVMGGKITEHTSASVGTTKKEKDEDFEQMFERASVAVRLAKLFGKNRVVEATKMENGNLRIIDKSNGDSYVYNSEIVEEGENKELKEYLLDEQEQVKFRIARDDQGKKYMRIHEVLDA